MKNLMTKFAIAFATLALGLVGVAAQESAAPTDSDAAAGLDLHAVAEMFKTSESLEKFEQALNSHETGINNLDLNKDDQVDFIHVTEKVADGTHLIILQTQFGEDDVQDVATIAVERESGENYNLQVQGDPVLYGENYYVVPANHDFSAWNVVRSLFRPNYHPFVSAYNYRSFPSWWGVRHPVLLSAYRARTGLLVGRQNFVASRTFTVKTLNRVAYHPRASAAVARRTSTTRTTTVVGPKGGTKTTTTTRKRGRP